MDRFKYSTVSHQGLRYCNPFSATKVESIIELLDLARGDRVLDVGTGKAELLIRLIERYDVEAVGIDMSSPFLQEAHEQAALRVPPSRFTLLEEDATTFSGAPESFQFASCLGACHIFGGFRRTLNKLSQFVRPGGYLLVGDGYWKQEPDAAYLQALETTANELMTHADNVDAGVVSGLVPLYSAVCCDDEWDRYEWLHLWNVERYCQQMPTDPDVPALLKRIRSWRDIYLRWGRATLGFGLYLFQK
ncbi:class I SAM-dependent methyltransferase [Ktedonosporobacter rubrisoli]|uniref:Class I SAM-dependent methyltransferase n=1 Tax=Ktedonosporobacter rubrisoli TaxID=2509675 RepID=A0A4P6JWZ9_KTERU|nr:class I SAM-dependent methyltransferase [Ktedonosporobacter rubrisoli]QBD79890.1 class I SAM-dependent methyltransferase [Ktedonosporobacter rubrisoli]